MKTIEVMIWDLECLGWKKYGGHMAYQSPDGRIYRGPALAWHIATGTPWKPANDTAVVNQEKNP